MAPFYIWIGLPISQLLLPADMLLFSCGYLLICEVRLLFLESFIAVITVKSTVSHVHSLFPKMSFQMFIQVISLRTYRDKPLLCICKTEPQYFQQFGITTLHIGLANFFPNHFMTSPYHKKERPLQSLLTLCLSHDYLLLHSSILYFVESRHQDQSQLFRISLFPHPFYFLIHEYKYLA